MKTNAARTVSDTQAQGLRVIDTDRAGPLSKCVRDALNAYLENMDGHEIKGLYGLVMEEFERPLFETILRHANGNLSHAAKMLGMTRNTLRKRLTDYSIDRDH